MRVTDANWLVIDTETTGPDPATCSIVELAAVPFDGGQPGPRMGALVHPGCAIPEASTAVHGITDEMVADCPSIEGVAQAFLRHVEAADVLVGYNIHHFDAPVLRRALGEPWVRAIEGKPIIDPLVIVRSRSVGKFWKGAGRHKLTSVCERFSLRPPVRAHRASADCILCGMLLWHLLTGYPGCSKLPRGAMELDVYLRKAAVEQQADFERYLAAQGGAP